MYASAAADPAGVMQELDDFAAAVGQRVVPWNEGPRPQMIVVCANCAPFPVRAAASFRVDLRESCESLIASRKILSLID